MTPMLSIIVPALNEAAGIVPTLLALAPLRARGAELIVVDGGSDDGTAELAAAHADRVVASARGRARQMNAGAAMARAPVLLFLHADTQLPAGADRSIQAAVARGARWGRFDVCITGRAGVLGVVAGMPEDGGEAIFTPARVVGWLAHAMEEYGEQPLRFRPRAVYVGDSA